MDEPDGWTGDGGAGLSADEAFALLANESRMAILRALWGADRPLPFSDLRDRAGVPDSGNFNYHLDRLVGHFVTPTEGGYALREAGASVMRAAVSGVITADATHEPQAVDERCPYCSSTVEFSYQDERLTVRCTSCLGVFSGGAYPPGTYMSYAFPPAGLTGRTPEEVIQAAHAFYDGKIGPMMSEVCPECAGEVSVDIDICEDHRTAGDGLCPECDTRYKVWSEYACTHCGYRRRSALWFKLMNHAAVIAFFHEHGGLNEFIPIPKLTWENHRFVSDITETKVSDDPLQIRVDIPLKDETLRVTVDGSLEIVDIGR